MLKLKNKSEWITDKAWGEDNALMYCLTGNNLYMIEYYKYDYEYRKLKFLNDKVFEFKLIAKFNTLKEAKKFHNLYNPKLIIH